MKIDSSFKPSPQPQVSRGPSKPADTAARPDAVILSPLAGALQGNEKPPVNTARIQEIKGAIAQGRFKIDPEAIASSLIETARDLVNSQRKG